MILINMEMPECCDKCFALDDNGDYPRCLITHEQRGYNFRVREKRMDKCPLIEVPPHGRLIDADALMQEFDKAERTMEQHGQEYACSFLSTSQELSTEWYCVEDILDNAPTVIPADMVKHE